MQALKKHLTRNLILILFSTLLSAYNPVMAEADHEPHATQIDSSQGFHGVFLGFVPCNDCPGIKTTLSLKQNNNYLLVTQPAKDSAREFYEKGKYTWNDENHTVVLTPRKGAAARHYLIEDEDTLIQLNIDGTRMVGDQANRYALHRNNMLKAREVHSH